METFYVKPLGTNKIHVKVFGCIIGCIIRLSLYANMLEQKNGAFWAPFAHPFGIYFCYLYGYSFTTTFLVTRSDSREPSVT